MHFIRQKQITIRSISLLSLSLSFPGAEKLMHYALSGIKRLDQRTRSFEFKLFPAKTSVLIFLSGIKRIHGNPRTSEFSFLLRFLPPTLRFANLVIVTQKKKKSEELFAEGFKFCSTKDRWNHSKTPNDVFGSREWSRKREFGVEGGRRQIGAALVKTWFKICNQD